MQPPKIATILALEAVHDARIMQVNSIDLLADRSGLPWKIALRTLEKLADKGLVEYGSSLNYCWLTEQGRRELHSTFA